MRIKKVRIENFKRFKKAFDEYRRAKKEGWDPSTLSRMAREYLQEQWETDRLSLADAKDHVLPRLKNWAKTNGLGQFSDKALAETMLPDELPQEVHQLARALAQFAGISIT